MYSKLIKLYILVEVGTGVFNNLFLHHEWEMPAYLMMKGEPIHSIYCLHKYSVPYYNYFHQQDDKIIIHLSDTDHKFAQEAKG